MHYCNIITENRILLDNMNWTQNVICHIFHILYRNHFIIIIWYNFAGIGIAMCLCLALTSVYYNLIIAWCMFYFFASFQYPLPWSSCDNSWNTAGKTLKFRHFFYCIWLNVCKNENGNKFSIPFKLIPQEYWWCCDCGNWGEV